MCWQAVPEVTTNNSQANKAMLAKPRSGARFDIDGRVSRSKTANTVALNGALLTCTQCNSRESLYGVRWAASVAASTPTAQNCSLRNSPHNRQLPDRISRITDCSSTVRMLYRNMY